MCETAMRWLQRTTYEHYENEIGMGGRADERKDSIRCDVEASVSSSLIKQTTYYR